MPTARSSCTSLAGGEASARDPLHCFVRRLQVQVTTLKGQMLSGVGCRTNDTGLSQALHDVMALRKDVSDMQTSVAISSQDAREAMSKFNDLDVTLHDEIQRVSNEFQQRREPLKASMDPDVAPIPCLVLPPATPAQRPFIFCPMSMTRQMTTKL